MNKKTKQSIKFAISLLEANDINPFCLGHFSLTIWDKTYTSEDETNKKALMVFPTLIDLFDSLVKLSKLNNGLRCLDTVGSSYNISFQKEKEGIKISVDKEILGLIDEKELAKAIWNGYLMLFEKHDLVPEKLGQLTMDFIDSVEAFEDSFELGKKLS